MLWDILNNPVVQIVLTLCVIALFILFCGLAKKVSLPSIVKTVVIVLTVVAAVVFNILYSRGNAIITDGGNYSMATMALAGSLIWVFIFGFALMAKTRKPKNKENVEAEA